MLGSEVDRHRIAASFMQTAAEIGVDKVLKVTGLEGEKPVMVAFDDELISDVFARIAWTSGYSNLVVVGEDRRMSVVSVLPSESAIREGEPLSPAEIHQDAKIGMLVEVAKAYDGLRIPVRLENVEGDVLSDAESVPVPA